MKLFHISDLHLGKTIYGKNMLEDQKDWVEKFLQKCEEEKPQAVLIAGDVYDSKIPKEDATRLLDYLLTKLSDLGIAVFLIAGNHDNGTRLSFVSDLLAKQKVFISGEVEKELKHYTLEDNIGPVNFWLVPYLYPEIVQDLLENEDIKTYEDAMRALLNAQEINYNERNVIIAHQFINKAGEPDHRGGSETTVAGIGAVDYQVFDGIEYVALGHIHSTYHVGRGGIRYAGTPLCYHFDEAKLEKAGETGNISEPKTKGIQEIIINKKGEEIEHRDIPITPLHRMRHITGTKEEVYAFLSEDKGRNEYVGIAVTDQKLSFDEEDYLRGLLENRGSMFVNVSPHIQTSETGKDTTDTSKPNDIPLDTLFLDFYKERKGGMNPKEDEYKLIQFLAELVGRQDLENDLDKDQKEEAAEEIIRKINRIGGGEQ